VEMLQGCFMRYFDAFYSCFLSNFPVYREIDSVDVEKLELQLQFSACALCPNTARVQLQYCDCFIACFRALDCLFEYFKSLMLQENFLLCEHFLVFGPEFCVRFSGLF